jgi:hypothetical protein
MSRADDTTGIEVDDDGEIGDVRDPRRVSGGPKLICQLTAPHAWRLPFDRA